MIRTSSAAALGALVLAARKREAAAAETPDCRAGGPIAMFAPLQVISAASFYPCLDGVHGEHHTPVAVDDGITASSEAPNRLSRWCR